MYKNFEPTPPADFSRCIIQGLVSNMRFFTFKTRAASILLIALMLSACSSNPYRPQTEGMAAVKARAESQTTGEVRVSVAAPSPEETEAIFDLPLYAQGVQPVWIEVENGGATDLRYAPVGTDPDYVPPFEVAFTHKSGFSGTALKEMQKYLYSNAMPRNIGAGEVRSGFVFTQARPGTKGVNIDLFGPEADEAYTFVFFVPVPGFVADHAQVKFETLYESADMATYDLTGLRKVLGSLSCCSSVQSGDRDGDPLNFILVGDGDDILQALLRAGWFERIATERDSSDSSAEAAYLYGRTTDAVFRKARSGTGERISELRLWMAPMQLGDQPVWVGDIIHILADPEGPSGHDPDIDDARDFFQYLSIRAWASAPVKTPARIG